MALYEDDTEVILERIYKLETWLYRTYMVWAVIVIIIGLVALAHVIDLLYL